MKVALLSFEFGEYAYQLARALSRDIHVLLLLPEQIMPTSSVQSGERLTIRPFHKPRLRQPLQQWRMIRSIHREIRRFNPDVIHYQQGHLWFNLSLPWLKGHPLVLTIHDPRYHTGDRDSQKTPQAIMDFGFRHANQVIVHGEQMKTIVTNQLRMPNQMVHALPIIATEVDKTNPPAPEDSKTVLFFGRIWEYKGLAYLIKAEPLVTSQVPTARLVIAGKGEDFARYRKMMVNPDHFVIHNDYIPDDQRAELFRSASVVVLPYIDATQTGVIPVAYSFSKPVVATAVGGLPDLVEHGVTGYLVPPRDEIQLAEAIVRLLRDDTLRHQMGLAARRKLEAEYSPEIAAHKTIAVYKQALLGA